MEKNVYAHEATGTVVQGLAGQTTWLVDSFFSFFSFFWLVNRSWFSTKRTRSGSCFGLVSFCETSIGHPSSGGKRVTTSFVVTGRRLVWAGKILHSKGLTDWLEETDALLKSSVAEGSRPLLWLVGSDSTLWVVKELKDQKGENFDGTTSLPGSHIWANINREKSIERTSFRVSYVRIQKGNLRVAKLTWHDSGQSLSWENSKWGWLLTSSSTWLSSNQLAHERD